MIIPLRVLLGLFALGFSLPALAVSRSCSAAGGESRVEGCLCVLTKTYINPSEDLCFDKTLAWLEQVGKEATRGCPEGSSTAEGGAKAISVDRAALCRDPEPELCDLDRNPELREYIEAAARFQKKALAVTESKEFQDFFRGIDPKLISVFDPKAPLDCYAFRDAESSLAQECMALKDALYEKNNDSAEGKKLAAEIFREAKADVLAYLLRRAAEAEKKGDSKAKFWRATAERIGRVELEFGTAGMVNAIAALKKDGRPICQMHGFHRFAGKNPEALRLTILHELGHHADPITYGYSLGSMNNFQFDPYRPEENPFHEQLECLRPFTQAVDVACLRRAPPEMLKSMIDPYLSLLEINPFASATFPTSNGVESCRANQFTETFADTFATEVYATTLARVSSVQLVRKLQESTSFHCEASVTRKADLGEPAFPPRELMHPPSKVRIETLLAHPEIRRRLGCDPKPSFPAREDFAPVQYCGGL